MKDYVQDVDALGQESSQQGKALFQVLSARGGRDRAVDIENALNQLRTGSAALLDRGRDLDVPDDAASAQRYLVESLEFRRDALASVADALPTALGDQERREGTDRVAAQMQAFLASDVIYSQRFVPSVSTSLRDKDLQGEVRVPRSQFLPDIEWLEPGFVADRVSSIRTGRGGGDERAKPGLHGNGIGSVTLGGQELGAGGSATVKLSDDLSFEVQVANQGENTETDVNVQVRVGKGDEAIELEEPLDSIGAGETKTVTIPFSEQPPTGRNVPIEVEVEPVPGEDKTDNNKQSYSAIFTR